jgi:hypothetical protein
MAVSIDSPYYNGPGAVWLKGNLHTHTTRSDGVLPPQETIAKYTAKGYDFLMLSDHDTLGEPEKLDGNGMLLIRGNEISAGGPHLLHVGANRRIEPDENRQQVIDAVNADGGLAILCHPNWQEHFNHYTFEKLLELKNYAGIEILNGTCLRLPGEARATDKWDRLLATGRMVWGYGNDDMHKDYEQALSWTVVRAKERSVPAVLDALKTGSCYVSSGVEIDQIRATGSVLHVCAPTAQAMAVFADYGARLRYQLGNEIYFDVADLKQTYVRVECYGPAGQMAWTQPLVIRGGKAEYLRSLGDAKPELRAAGTRVEPKMTGRLEDPAWAKAQASTRFLDMASGDPAGIETAVKCLRSRDQVIFGIRCSEPQMEQLLTHVTADGDPNTWSDDSVEIFLDPGASGTKYLHLMISAAGYGYSTWMPQGGRGPAPRIAASRNAAGWTAEVALPLAAFGEAGRSKEWGLHVCRNRKPRKETYFWAWVGSSNHTPDKFGRLMFDHN